MYQFEVVDGIYKPSMHVHNKLAVYVVDDSKKLTIPLDRAVKNGIVNRIEGNKYYTFSPYLLIMISQLGFKVPSYLVYFAVELGGDEIIKISTFTKNNLHFTAKCAILSPLDEKRLGLDFINSSSSTPPIHITASLIERRITSISGSRQLCVTKE